MDEKALKKSYRKLKRCEEVLFKHQNIKTSSEPSKSLFLGNGGFGCGFTRENLVDIFSPFGTLNNIILLPDKPYAFIIYNEKADAVNALNSLNGQKVDLMFRPGYALYMSFISDSEVPQVLMPENPWPPGLVLLENFLTEEEESILLSIFSCKDVSSEKAVLKHRKVKHFGYEFVYGSNDVDKSCPLNEKIPNVCIPYLEKVVTLGYLPKVPDQLTVNHYLPGQGIPPHIDTHSAFEDGIISLSLGSQVVMDFYHPNGRSVPILLPRRSLIVMLGECRYLWRHGITPRKTDVISSKEGSKELTLCHRMPRTSLTFRLIREGECTCDYKDQCNSQRKIRTSVSDVINNKEAQEIEKKYVNQVYEEIADHFSNTRYKPWPKIETFLNSVSPGSFILDVGCGNGKNMKLSNGCYEVGCDASSNLVQVCKNRDMEVVVADCLKLPFKDNCADVVICIAVIHHISTKVRRTKAVQEIIRILRPGGKALIYVWAFEQEGQEGQSKYLKKSKSTDDDLTPDNDVQIIDICDKASLPVHRNKSDFRQQDVLVPWKNNTVASICHRYYHVFVKGELESLVQEDAEIIHSYYDEGNWCVIITK